ncbi:MAG: hypothetical protein FAZ92_01828 [Accumulibacter sp.]|nr:MAG: hypothetical protein FAZ92_01828 [Accumulibacter sp.]
MIDDDGGVEWLRRRRRVEGRRDAVLDRQRETSSSSGKRRGKDQRLQNTRFMGDQDARPVFVAHAMRAEAQTTGRAVALWRQEQAPLLRCVQAAAGAPYERHEEQVEPVTRVRRRQQAARKDLRCARRRRPRQTDVEVDQVGAIAGQTVLDPQRPRRVADVDDAAVEPPLLPGRAPGIAGAVRCRQQTRAEPPLERATQTRQFDGIAGIARPRAARGAGGQRSGQRRRLAVGRPAAAARRRHRRRGEQRPLGRQQAIDLPRQPLRRRRQAGSRCQPARGDEQRRFAGGAILRRRQCPLQRHIERHVGGKPCQQRINVLALPLALDGGDADAAAKHLGAQRADEGQDSLAGGARAAEDQHAGSTQTPR